MNIYDINKDTIRSISNKELILIHYRVHQLYGAYVDKQSSKIDELKKFLKKAHVIIMYEMNNRDLKHSSVIKYLNKINST
jgi:hypothetical protein